MKENGNFVPAVKCLHLLGSSYKTLSSLGVMGGTRTIYSRRGEWKISLGHLDSYLSLDTTDYVT